MLMDGGGICIQTSLTACEYFNKNNCEKDMNKEVTAEWARSEANRVLGEKVLKQLERCEEVIREAVSNNKMSTNFFGGLHDLSKKELNKRGFKVEYKRDSPIDSGYHEISW